MNSLRLSQAASRLGVCEMTLHRWAAKGLIPFIQLPSGQRRFRETDLANILRPIRGRPPKSTGEKREA